MKTEKRILQLRSEIRRHNRLYYDQDSPEISDAQYDKLVAELKEASPNDPVLNEMGNPTYGDKFTHGRVMGSLDKCHSTDEIVAKFQNKRVVLMPKIDGLSMAVHYSDGELATAATRGDGKTGEVVTPNAVRITNLPLNIAGVDDEVETRGEVFVPIKSFFGIMDQPGYDGKPDGLKNPRNAAAGGLRQRNPKMTAARKLQYVAYKLWQEPVRYADPRLGKRILSQHEALEWLKDHGFLVCPHVVLTVGDSEKLQAAINSFKSMDLPYEIDGVVIMLDDLAEFDKLGLKGKYPVGALAYKFKDEEAEAPVLEIQWETSRNGRVVPVAVIEPTEIGGSTVSRITMNNLDWLTQNDVAVGDVVAFRKANEIIPCLIGVVKRASVRNRNLPSKCPSCGSPLVHSTNSTGEGVDLVCVSDTCPAQFIKLVRHVLKSLDVKGIAEATLERLADAGLLAKPEDIFAVTAEQMVAKGFGKSEAANIASAVRSAEASPARLLKALGINGWGETLWTKLMSVSRLSADEWLEPTFTDEKYQEACRVGDVRAEALRDGFLKMKGLLEALKANVRILRPSKGGSSGAKDRTFLITGTLSQKRSEIEKRIVASGGTMASSVSKNLNYLVIGEEPGSKLDKAKKLGIPTIGEDELNKMLQ
jgi:DNA ligase (NAD+)